MAVTIGLIIALVVLVVVASMKVASDTDDDMERIMVEREKNAK